MDSEFASAVARGGWHPVEWACEFVGTAGLLLGGLSAVCFTMGPHSSVRTWLPNESARLLLTGLLFAGTGSLMALCPWGRRSGAHLNPAVTLAFWIQGKVHPHDVIGYVVAQLLGAFTGAAVVLGVWRGTARAVNTGATRPGHGFNGVQAALLEAAMTALLVLMILLLTSQARTARWTPLGNWLLVATLVWQFATYTGTSLNPARSFGPAIVASVWSSHWVYIAGPLSGCLVACGAFALLPTLHTQTAKVFHDPAYRSTLGSEMPVAASR